MTGKTMMPDNFDEYFEKWLARKITQKEIATELRVSQSVVSNWIIQFRKDSKMHSRAMRTMSCRLDRPAGCSESRIRGSENLS